MGLLEPLFRQAETGTFNFISHNSEQEVDIREATQLLTGHFANILWISLDEIKSLLAEGKLDYSAWATPGQISEDRRLVRQALGYVPDEAETNPIMAKLEDCLWHDLFVGLLQSICGAIEQPFPKKEADTQTRVSTGDWLSRHRPEPPQPKPQPGLRSDQPKCEPFWHGLRISLTNAIFLTIMDEITKNDALYGWQAMVEIVSQGLLPIRRSEQEWWIVTAK
ncbi:hypothetical protein COY93_02555 [Candidatus Uhrbacteria bacterium CG_4_10_14_0_8_um_filter_58_22]|uniref:Uncharacterized protein n=1 Tax=Candidatus Uhrbacteria bacterium CG_4_10_14_0_8_um_filter_58_22 TaxID=1975029 RepID=A0A2M7Q9Y0_9BACT|nr:MAG: hypothetical protein COY93_02555 [Candidatus Uhrbacteria bacterium CG_4_10_14_0_8_um_filter_58_22]